MAGHGEKLSRQSEQAIAALLCESTVAAAAAKVGVAEKTLRRWLQRPEFATAYKSARAEVLSATLNRLAGLAVTAVEALKRNLTDGAPAVQVRCATAVLAEIRTLMVETDTGERLEA